MFTLQWTNRLGQTVDMKSILYQDELAKWVEILINECKTNIKIKSID